MRVLVLDAFPSDHADRDCVGQAIDRLEQNGNTVELVDLSDARYDGFMTAAERTVYETDEPLIADVTKAGAASLLAADAVLFCYPTVLFGVPPRLKSWIERVMVMGVAFVFDEKQRVRPGLKNIGRIGVLTTTPHDRRSTLRARDQGYRTFMRTLRLNCHPLCRRTFLRLPSGSSEAASQRAVAKALRPWK